MKKFVIACALVVASMGSAFANGAVEEKKVAVRDECCITATITVNGSRTSASACAATCETAYILAMAKLRDPNVKTEIKMF